MYAHTFILAILIILPRMFMIIHITILPQLLQLQLQLQPQLQLLLLLLLLMMMTMMIQLFIILIIIFTWQHGATRFATVADSSDNQAASFSLYQGWTLTYPSSLVTPIASCSSVYRRANGQCLQHQLRSVMLQTSRCRGAGDYYNI